MHSRPFFRAGLTSPAVRAPLWTGTAGVAWCSRTRHRPRRMRGTATGRAYRGRPTTDGSKLTVEVEAADDANVARLESRGGKGSMRCVCGAAACATCRQQFWARGWRTAPPPVRALHAGENGWRTELTRHAEYSIGHDRACAYMGVLRDDTRAPESVITKFFFDGSIDVDSCTALSCRGISSKSARRTRRRTGHGTRQLDVFVNLHIRCFVGLLF